MCSIIVNDVGEQADNSQHAENDFAWVQTFTSFQSSEKFSTASMMRSTTAPIAWKIGLSAIMRIASFQSVRIQQFAGHLVKEFRIVQHLLDFFLRAAVVQECLHLVGGYAERLRHAE